MGGQQRSWISAAPAPRVRGAAAPAACALYLIAARVEPALGRDWLASASAAALFCGGLLLAPRPAAGRLLSVAGLLGLAAAVFPAVVSRPGLSLAAALAAAATAEALWFVRARPGRRIGGPAALGASAAAELRAAGLFCLAVSLASGSAPQPSGAERVAAALAHAFFYWRFAVFLSLRRRGLARLSWFGGAPLLIVGGAAAAVAAFAGRWDWAMAAAALPQTPALIPSRGERVARALERGGLWEALIEAPAALLLATFFTLCVIGSALLSLPVSAADGVVIEPLDAVFTAVSAVCVTGLIVLDTPNDFSVVGQAFILILVQLGGLGIMAYASAAFIALRRRFSLRYERAATELAGARGRGDLSTSLRGLFLVTFLSEGVGALALAALFSQAGDSWGRALWRGLFTAVSAFCNAGFALQSDSLIPYQHQPAVIHVVAVLIILGGLSPAGVIGLTALARRRRINLQVKLVLSTTAIVLGAGFLFFTAVEWNNSLAGMSWSDRLNNAWFLSATRTAGFTTFDVSALHPAALLVLVALMVVGGSPGGTAGGIKTMAAAVLALGFIAVVRRRETATVFGRRFPPDVLLRAATTAMAGLVIGFCGLTAVLLTQTLDFPTASFEVVSAVATVGLSIGGTAELDGLGKIIIMVCMFTGRVGPLTLWFALSTVGPTGDELAPEEVVDVG